jgi:hypothetical protein
LYKKSASQRHYALIYPNQQDANLVLSTLRHQRDLFSGGSLGIPDVNTHVGSVIHAFENLAYQRQLREGAEKTFESSKSSSSAGMKDSIFKINLPAPPSKRNSQKVAKKRAPDVPPPKNTPTVSAMTQTAKYSADENESSVFDSLNVEDADPKNTKKFPHAYVKNIKALPLPPERKPSKIPTKSNQVKNSLESNKARSNVFLKPKAYTEDDIENDFLRGSTVSQSFVKNVARKSPNVRKMSTYEQNFLINNENQAFDSKPRVDRSSKDHRNMSSKRNLEQPLIDEVSLRYNEYNSNNNLKQKERNMQTKFQPNWNNHAEL